MTISSLLSALVLCWSNSAVAASGSAVFVTGNLDRPTLQALEKDYAAALNAKPMNKLSSCETRQCVESELVFLGLRNLVVIEFNLVESVYSATAEYLDGSTATVLKRASAEDQETSTDLKSALLCDMADEMAELEISDCATIGGVEASSYTIVNDASEALEVQDAPETAGFKERSEEGYISRNLTNFQPALLLGLQPNDPMANRYLYGVNVLYLTSPKLGVSADFIYSPDLGTSDVKGLTNTLVQIASSSESGGVSFQQPLEKMLLYVGAAAHYEFFGNRQSGLLFAKPFVSVGAGMMSTERYYAKYDPSAAEGQPPTLLESAGRQTRIPVSVGTGSTFWPGDNLGIKLRLQGLIYTAPGPQYDPNATIPPEKRFYHNLLATIEFVLG